VKTGIKNNRKEGENMRVTYHAGERLIERVFEFAKYSHAQVIEAMRLIKRDLADINCRNRKFIPLPSFPGFYGVVADRTLVTVIPKSYRKTKK
jgi:hypothetical protein